MNCDCCKQTCVPVIPGTPSSGCVPQLTERSSFAAVYDDNGDIRRLRGNGILVANDNDVYHTDGSQDNGGIPINPDNIDGGDSILITYGAKLYSLGKNVPEGSTLIYRSGKWVILSTQEKSLIFSPEKIRTGATTLAGFVCGANGTVELGSFIPNAPDSIIYYDEDGKLTYQTLEEFGARFADPLAASIPEAGSEDTIAFYLAVTEDGKLVKTTDLSSGYNWLNPAIYISSQMKYINLAVSALPVYPPFPPFVNGNFSSTQEIVNLEGKPGYSDVATAVIITCYFYAYNNLAGNSWNGVLVVNGVERCRIAVAGLNSYMNQRTQITVPIPSDKKLVIDYYRQDVANVGYAEVVSSGVLLESFITL